MAKRRIGVIALLLCLCLCWIPGNTRAASTTDTTPPISLSKSCALAITYRYDTEAFADLPVKLYRVADVSADFQYTLTPAFADSGLILNGIRTTGEWDVIRTTLESYILAQQVPETLTAVTDIAGQVIMNSLQPGLYLAVTENVEHTYVHYHFDSALIALPGLAEDGSWQYQVEVTAKSEALPPVNPDEEIEMKVLKLWKGDTSKVHRPESVQVEIFRDGVSYETVTLSEENLWSYSWQAKNDGAKWQVVERSIPEGYTVTVEERETSFILTNTWDSPEIPPLPPTGDTANVMLYIVLMYVSGAMLILLAILGKRKRT